MSHFITVLSWLIFSTAMLSFVSLQLPAQSLPAFLHIVSESWQTYIHAPILQFIGLQFQTYIDLVIALFIVIHSLIRQKSRLNRIHKDLAIALVNEPVVTSSLENSFSASDTKNVLSYIELAKAGQLQSDAPHYPRSNWLFTAQSMLLVSFTFAASVWLLLQQII